MLLSPLPSVLLVPVLALAVVLVLEVESLGAATVTIVDDNERVSVFVNFGGSSSILGVLGDGSDVQLS